MDQTFIKELCRSLALTEIHSFFHILIWQTSQLTHLTTIDLFIHILWSEHLRRPLSMNLLYYTAKTLLPPDLVNHFRSAKLRPFAKGAYKSKPSICGKIEENKIVACLFLLRKTVFNAT